MSDTITSSVSQLSSTPCQNDELDQYLKAEAKDTQDPLSWWYNECCNYPHLYQMALGFLSIPCMFASIKCEATNSFMMV